MRSPDLWLESKAGITTILTVVRYSLIADMQGLLRQGGLVP